MLAFFRRLIGSKAGLVFVFIFLAVIAFAFVSADLSNLNLSNTGATGTTVATIGDVRVDSAELNQRAQRRFDAVRAERTEMTLTDFVNAGGLESTVNQVIDGLSVSEFGRQQGMSISRRLEDGQIASIPQFLGLNGEFDRARFDQFLQSNRISENQFRNDMARDEIANQLILPVSGAVRAPATLITPYASMLLEGRVGHLGFVPVTAVNQDNPPTDAEIKSYYDRNVARYTVPERRTVRYALISRDHVTGAATPTEQEIAKYYKDNQAKYAGSETRGLTQVILPSEAAAKKLVAAAGGGLEQAARAAGLEATRLDPQTKVAFIELSSAAVATAAFSAAKGAISAPMQSGLGWHVTRVDSIETVPGRSLDQVRPEIVAALTTQKAETALADYLAKIDEDISGGSTYDEVIADQKLTSVTTKPLLTNGRDPDTAGTAATPEMTAIFEAVSGSEPDDDPLVAQIVPNQTFALVDLESNVAAAPRPLAQIRERVVADFSNDRAMTEAKRVADSIVQKINAGTPMAQAMTAAGVRLPTIAAIGGTRQQIMQSGQPVPPALALMFSMVEKRARALEAPGRAGWQIVYLDSIQRGDATKRPDVIAAARAQFGGVLGQEYVQQFTAAARNEVKVTRNPEAVTRLKREMTGLQ